MNVEALMDLREQVDKTLLKHRAELETQLAKMGKAIAVVGARGGRSPLKGMKVPSKYRSSSGETWAGRGVRPRWLVDAIKGGRRFPDRQVGGEGTEKAQVEAVTSAGLQTYRRSKRKEENDG